MFKKFKQKLKAFATGKSGFSLVELIVVIAIMAVMAAVLAPSLLSYVERSRAQKDDSAMGEVTNAMKLSLADQNVYDELLPYAVKGNFSCYCDGDTSTNIDDNKTITKAPDYWLFTDEARKLDETPYKPAGSMRGATVTFKPNGEAEYILKAGVVNQIGDESTKKGTNGGVVLADCPELYNRLRSTVGDTIKVSSQTYRNSTYTIFISMGTTGGNQADKQDAIQVYGQYNGTNLPEVMTATGKGDQNVGNATPDTDIESNEPQIDPTLLVHEGTVPQLGRYVTANGVEYIEGSNFPTPKKDDRYYYGDYVYIRSGNYGGWRVEINTEVTDKLQTEYGPLLHSIAGQTINSLFYTYSHCINLTTAPEIPETVRSLNATFYKCQSLVDLSDYHIPLCYDMGNEALDYKGTFEGCTSLKYAPDISNFAGQTMWHTFKGCVSLVEMPAIKSQFSKAIVFEGCTQFGY